MSVVLNGLRPDKDDVAAFLEAATVYSVDVYAKTDTVCPRLSVPTWPTAAVYREINRFFAQAYKGGATVAWLPYQEGGLETLLDPSLELWMAVLAVHAPMLEPWLREAHWTREEAAIEVRLPHALAQSTLMRQKADEMLSALLGRMTGLAPRIHFAAESEALPDAKPLNLRHEEPPAVTTAAKVAPQQGAPFPQRKTRGGEKRPTRRSANVLYGRHINAMPTPILELTEEENKVTCEGSVFDCDLRILKSGRALFTFAITDLTSSVECKLFCSEEEGEALKQAFKADPAAKISGALQIDPYSHELTLRVDHINHTVLACRLDSATEKRVELHLHTQMSNMDGVSSLESLVKLASEMGHTHMAITDHGVVQSFPDAYKLGKKYNVQILYGMEAYIFDDSIPESQKPRTYHCILIAKNMTGLKDLYRLTTESHLRYFKRRPRIPKRLIQYAREGLIVGSACEAGELMQHLVHHPEDEEGLIELSKFYDYIEIQPLDNNEFMIRKRIVEDRQGLEALNKRLFALGKAVGKPVIATCDVHFANKEDAIFRSILMAGKGFGDAEEQAPLYYRSTNEMLEEFSYLGEEEAHRVVVDNPNRIIADCEILQPVPDELYAPEILNAEAEIERLTYTKAHALYGDPLPELVQKRIDKELKAIIGNGFSVLYYIAHALVKKSNDDGYVVGSRGSVGSSVVAYFTNITEVNALPPHYRCPACRYSRFDEEGAYGTGVDMPDAVCPECGTPLVKDGFNIPFEIFLGFKGDKVPDIDLNFSGEYQPHAHAFTEDLFGKDNVFRAGTIATVAEKTAFGYVRKFFDERQQILRNAEINRLRNGCTGVKRTTGQHPGGLMVIPIGVDVHDFTPLQRPADDVKTETVTTHFDYHSINERLVKLDILGHDDPTVIKMLEDLTDIDVSTIPLDDPETMSLFSSTEVLGLTPKELNSTVATYGIPEFNTKFTRQMLEDIKPESFAALLRISGFSHGTDVWLNNAQDLIRSGTAGVTETISTRDDIMIYLIQHGMDFSLSFKIMEGVRKGRGLTPEQVEAMEASDIPPWFIESCQKIKYLFPKAHAVAYVMMAYRIAWFKINHPLAFYASYFSVRGADEFDLETVLEGKTRIRNMIDNIYGKGVAATAKEKAKISVLEVALEMVLRGFSFLPVDLYESDATRFRIIDGKICPPLTAIEGMGQTSATIIASAREARPFISVEDLKNRGKVGDGMIEVMRKLSIIDQLPDSNQINLF